MKEKYEEIKELITYDDHKWIIWVDLKMVNFLNDPQIGKLIKDENFFLSMTEVEKDAWDANTEQYQSSPFI